MRVIWPYTDRATEESYRAVMALGLPVETYDVSRDDFAYGRLLEALWGEGGTFLVIEHDIIVSKKTIKEFAICPEEWCSSPYTYFDQPVTTSGGGLGCTKFSKELMGRWPTMMRQAMEIPSVGHEPWHWCGCDYRIYTLLRAGGNFASQYPARRHQTHTEVRHRAGKCSHGCKDEL
jgi:hypothetical protein